MLSEISNLLFGTWWEVMSSIVFRIILLIGLMFDKYISIQRYRRINKQLEEMQKKWEISQEDIDKMHQVRKWFSKAEKEGRFENKSPEEIQEILNNLNIHFRTTN